MFETILVLDGRPVELESHLGRLGASLARLYRRQLSAAPRRPGRGCRLREAGCLAPDASAYSPDSAHELSWELSLIEAPEALRSGQVRSVRLVPALLPGGLGCHKLQDRRVLSRIRQDLGLDADEQLILLDEDGTVLETDQANVFAVVDGVLRTAPDEGRIRAGTTREVVIALAASAGIEVSTEPFRLCDLALAEEIFLTSSIRGVSAVSELRGQQSFSTGPVAVSLLARPLASLVLVGVIGASPLVTALRPMIFRPFWWQRQRQRCTTLSWPFQRCTRRQAKLSRPSSPSTRRRSSAGSPLPTAPFAPTAGPASTSAARLVRAMADVLESGQGLASPR